MGEKAADTMDRTSNAQKNDWQITKEEIENCILGLANGAFSSSNPKKRKSIQEVIPLKQMFKILVNAIELFRNEPTLLEFGFDRHCVIIGDLHGYINDLLGTLILTVLPPDQTFLFLGDYVGRGNCQLDVLTLVVLLKLRWPKHVFVLRGNHESPMGENDGFRQSCANAYRKHEVFTLCHVMFDYLPLAAIIEDRIFCCHGGISQWLVSRDAIKQIQRPVYVTETPLLDLLIVTDLLWADPSRDSSISERLYSDSRRHASYVFSECALRAILRNLNCDVLIRGHEAVESGITCQWKYRCYTVHTTTREPTLPTRPGFIGLSKSQENGKILIETDNNPLDALSLRIEEETLYTQLQCYFNLQFKRKESSDVPKFTIEKLHEAFHLPSRLEVRRFLNYTDLCNWSLKNGEVAMHSLRRFSAAFYVFDNIRSFAINFPLLLDLILADGKSFRTQLTSMEKLAIETIHKCRNFGAVPLNQWPKILLKTPLK